MSLEQTKTRAAQVSAGPGDEGVGLASDEVVSLTLADVRRIDRQTDSAAGPSHPASCLRPGVLAPSGVAVAGHDGHLFIADGANRWERQYRGELKVTDAWLDGWAALLERRQREARARGVELWNVVAPEKQVMLHAKRWPDLEDPGRERPLIKLMARLGPEHRLSYPEAAMRASEALAPAYYRHNSHWTASGCCAAVQALLDQTGGGVDLGAIRLRGQVRSVQHDLSVHFFDPAPFEDRLLLLPSGEIAFDNRLFERTGRHTGTSYGVRNPEAPDPRRLIIFGDSYARGAGLSATLSAVFGETVFVWSKAVLWDLVASHRSQVVIWESAERFIATLPQG